MYIRSRLDLKYYSNKLTIMIFNKDPLAVNEV